MSRWGGDGGVNIHFFQHGTLSRQHVTPSQHHGTPSWHHGTPFWHHGTPYQTFKFYGCKWMEWLKMTGNAMNSLKWLKFKKKWMEIA